MSSQEPNLRRVGLEQEFFLVDEMGAISHRADEFLSRCRIRATEQGLSPGYFKGESAHNMVEVITGPNFTLTGLTKEYLEGVRLALEVGRGLGLRLYPLATYPLPIIPIIRDDLSYQIKVRTIGRERYLHSGRCAGIHLHLELPDRTLTPYSGPLETAPAASRQELLDVYNLATALDPALVALSRACPFYEGSATGLATRTLRYRGSDSFDVDGVYKEISELGTLQPYAASVQDLLDQQNRRLRAWLGSMERSGVDRRLFFESGGTPLKAAWNPIRLNRYGTVEIRSMDSNYPEIFLPIAAMILNVAARVRRDGLRVKPSHDARTFEVDGGTLLIPAFERLSKHLLYCAVTDGVEHPDIADYLDSILNFATNDQRDVKDLAWLKPYFGGYRTTEMEILKDFPTLPATIERDEGLRLAKSACDRLENQVALLHDAYDIYQEPLPS